MCEGAYALECTLGLVQKYCVYYKIRPYASFGVPHGGMGKRQYTVNC